MTNSRHSRRQFLRHISLISAGAALSTPTYSSQIVTGSGIHHPQEMSLALSNLHTGEELKTTFYCDGAFVPESLNSICHLLRDHRNGKVGSMDPELMVLIHDLQHKLGVVGKPVEVISGYRSPETNAQLSQKSSKVAKKSLHMQGKAIDIRIPGVRLTDLHRAARQLNRGGVGLYTRSNFVHLDIGRPRYWGS